MGATGNVSCASGGEQRMKKRGHLRPEILSPKRMKQEAEKEGGGGLEMVKGVHAQELLIPNSSGN